MRKKLRSNTGIFSREKYWHFCWEISIDSTSGNIFGKNSKNNSAFSNDSNLSSGPVLYFENVIYNKWNITHLDARKTEGIMFKKIWRNKTNAFLLKSVSHR